ncbi:LCP family protein [Sporosarcina cyprini]|uniref:LCP family protein n=1 Tax=Sporosarcina cyprini TaxID=2910523 RepID=UPI001EDF1CAB|nr:LCP family protein [Sporosarcina cyprini]MCG3088774.1 LCP family protein [Sporosarcina cyprini]
MKGKFVEEKYMADQELHFTSADRKKVFRKIAELEKNVNKKSVGIPTRIFAPLTISLLVVGLCVLLFTPLFSSVSVFPMKKDIAASESASKVDEVITTLISVKDETNRIPINFLFSYNKAKEKVKVLSIPRDTYVPIENKDGTIIHDKMTFAYMEGAGAESVKNTVSELFDLPIDYYAVIDLESFSQAIDSVSGIDHELKEEIRVRAISQPAFEFQKGINRLNGEEVLALLMDATVGKNLDDEDLLNLISDVMNKTKNGISQIQYNNTVEGNMPIKQFFEDKREIRSLQLVSLIEGKKDVMINEKYYIKFEKAFLHSATEKLTHFD